MIWTAVRYVLAVHAIVLGTGYLLGPEQFYSGGTFAVVRSLGIPIAVWGGLIAFAGVLLLLRYHTVGHGLALVAFVFWGLCLGATLVTGQLSGWGSPVHNLVLVAPLHALGLWVHGRSRVDTKADQP